MNAPKVSVIVPVYNVAPYLEKCLHSLVNQTLKEIEIIVVDDGSTDDSPAIIEKFAAEHTDKIKAYRKENGGLSDARNYGLNLVTGEYIGFIDSDDFVDLDMYEVMYQKAKEADYQIVECNLHHTYADWEDTEIGKEIIDNKELLMDGRSVVWNKIYRADWLKATEVQFHKGIIYEDVEFFSKIVPYIESYVYVEPAFVHYVQRGSSINNKSSMKTLHILSVLDEILSFYKERGFYEEYKDALEYLFARITLCSSFSRMCRIPDRKLRKQALDSNYQMLVEHFPTWKKNAYIKRNNSKNGFFMKTINHGTYGIYSKVLPGLFMLRAKIKGL